MKLSERVLVSWRHFTRPADGPNIGPRLEAAERLYNALLKAPAWIGVIVTELPVEQAMEGHYRGFDLQSLRELARSNSRRTELQVRFGLSHLEFEVLDELLLSLTVEEDFAAESVLVSAKQLCSECGSPMDLAGDWFVCPCGTAVSASDDRVI